MPEPPPESPPTGRQRLREAVVRPGRPQLVVAVLLAMVGFAAMTQVSHQQDEPTRDYREQDLIDVLNGLAGTSQRAQAEIRGWRTPGRLLRAPARGKRRSRRPGRRTTPWRSSPQRAGRRPGNPDHHRGGRRPGRIDSLLDMVQALRTAGAEAIQFNGEVRVVAQTSFEDGVGGIEVDGQLLEPPYVIDVIGEPATLAGGLVFAQGPIDQLEDDGASVDVDELRRSTSRACVPRPGRSSPTRHRRSSLPTFARPEETSCTPRT